MPKKEKSFQSEITRSFKTEYPECFYTKIPDAPYSPSIIQRPIEKPFDCEAFFEGVFLAMELKVVTQPTFPLSHIKEHQIHNLLVVGNNNGKAYFLFNVSMVVPDNIKQKFNTKNRLNFCHFLPIQEYIKLVDSINRKSLPFDYFYDCYTNNINILERCKVGKYYGWRVDKLWNM